MRKFSLTPLHSQKSEPLIVVEDNEDDEENKQKGTLSAQQSEDESMTLGLGTIEMNPFFLSPFAREIRKHSLPTPQCSGITASQVRRLSERSETAGPGPRQTEFLATLSSVSGPSPGGRRHSVVTISRVPPTIIGSNNNRRESVAGFPTSTMTRILPNRRESIACPPSTEPRGSVHNLQLDIMDDIVQARKVRMKLWNTSNERVCEVQPLDENSTIQRYTNSRRFSDFVGTTLAPIPSSTKRRASELPQKTQQTIPPTTTSSSSSTTTTSKQTTSGIICSNTDLISILSSLSASATEINQIDKTSPPPPTTTTTTIISTTSISNGTTTTTTTNTTTTTTATTMIDHKRNRLKNTRSNSFDVSVFHEINQLPQQNIPSSSIPSSWLTKRHEPKIYLNNSIIINCSNDNINLSNTNKNKKEKERRVIWDDKSIVDPHALGSAIEGYLRKTSPSSTDQQTSPQKNKSLKGPSKSITEKVKTTWFSSGSNTSNVTNTTNTLSSTNSNNNNSNNNNNNNNNGNNNNNNNKNTSGGSGNDGAIDNSENNESSSLYSTFKELFVK